MKAGRFIIFLYILFTLVYATIGDPSSNVWSGMYFAINYLLILQLLNNEKSKVNRYAGKSVCIGILVYVIAKYFCNIYLERYVTTIIVFICIAWCFYNDTRK